MADIFDQVATSSAPAGDVFDQAASHAGYWQELYQQSGIPGLVKGLKEHPAETIAGAIGGLFAPLNPNFTQSEQGKALKENLTRSPESLAAALTLGGVAAAPAAGKLAPGALSATAEAAGNAAKFTSAAAKTAAPGLISAGAKLAAGHALSAVPGLEWPARLALEYPAIHQGIKTIGKAYQAGKAAIKPAEEAATAAAEAVQEAAKAPGQVLAEADGQIWSKLGQDDKLSYAQLEGAQKSSAARSAAAPAAATPRPPDYYGVKPAEVPPQPAPSASAPTPASAAPPSVPISPQVSPSLPLTEVNTPKVQPIRPETPPVPTTPPTSEPTSAPTTPKPASGAIAAKSARYADAIGKWARDHGMSVKQIADQWENASPEAKGQIYIELQRQGYLGANETIPKTSAQGIVDALKAKAATIKPPAGFSLGDMGVR